MGPKGFINTFQVFDFAPGGQTQLLWEQEFESPELAAKLRKMCEKANEENLDRLEAVLGLRRDG